jgi:hypothetical protein
LFLARRFSYMYDRNVGSSAPPEGSAPNGKPSAVPRSHGRHERLQSARESHAKPVAGSSGTAFSGSSRRREAMNKVSPTANRPTITTTTSMPSSNDGTPKVNRAWPVSASMPTTPRNRPKVSDIRPRTRDAPTTAVTVTIARRASAK